MQNDNEKPVTPSLFVEKLGSTITKDGVLKEIHPDFITEVLTEQQLANWKSAVEEKDSKYFIKNSISVEMTPEQHEALSTFVKDAFGQLNKENNYQSELVKIFITDHFVQRIRQRKSRKINTSIMHRATLREFVTNYKNVENVFRWSDKGLTYRLKNDMPSTDPSSYERISFSVFLSKGEIVIYINVITYINKQRRKKKKPKK